MKHAHHLTWAATVALAAVGCGTSSDGLPREPISGEVQLDGRPLETGLITFTPVGGVEPVVSGVVVDGRFALDRADGPTPGPHRVDVWAKKPTGRKLRNPDEPGEFVEETREAIPARYNLDSQLKAEVKEGGSNHFDFELSGAKVALNPKRGRFAAGRTR
jgi:hypothetical protein